MFSHGIKMEETSKSKPLFPHANAHSIEEYFALPKLQREKWGLYLMPIALPCDIFGDGEEGFKAFSSKIRKEYPVQGFIREWVLSWDNPAYAFLNRIGMKLSDARYSVKRFITPACPRFRKAYPRHTYKDITGAVVDINFALILDFWHEEVVDGHVDWESDDEHIKFHTELKNAVNYLEIERPQLQEKIELALSEACGKSYEEKYGEYDRLGEQLTAKDSEILIWFMKQRDAFWT